MWSTASVQITTLVDFFQVIAHSNFLFSALNTIAAITIMQNSDENLPFTLLKQYFDKNSTASELLELPNCGIGNSIAPAGFHPLSYEDSARQRHVWPEYSSDPELERNTSAMADGFFGGCTPLSAILASSLDCLYKHSCLEQFDIYFPGLNQVSLSLSSFFPYYLLLSRPT